MIVKRTLTTCFALAVISLARAPRASSLTNADYSITSESIDSAGANAQSAHYLLRASGAGEFGVASTASISSANYLLESGYVARLRDVLAPTSVVSRKVHGPAGTFDIDLPFTGSVGIECRSGGASNSYKAVFIFPSAVTVSDATVTPGAGGTASLENPHTSTSADGTAVTVNLTGVSNAQTITITLVNVNDGGTTINVRAQMGILLGDTSGNGTVNATDVSQTKLKSGQAVGCFQFSRRPYRQWFNQQLRFIDGEIEIRHRSAVKSRFSSAQIAIDHGRNGVFT